MKCSASEARGQVSGKPRFNAIYRFRKESDEMSRLEMMLYIGILSAVFPGILTSYGNSRVSEEENRSSDGYYDIEFHRGGRDARPENTLYSYQYALENGASAIECDMQFTADGQIVLSHNPALNPDITTDSNGDRIEAEKYYIHDMTLNEIQSFNVGRMDTSCEYYDMHGRTQVSADAYIPSLRQLFELVRDSGNETVRMSIEAKYYPDPESGTAYEKNPDRDRLLTEFLSLVREFGFEKRVILQSFDWEILVRMEKLDPEIETIALYCEQRSWGGADSTTLWYDREEASPWLAGINIHDFDSDPVKAAHHLGIDDISPYYEEITKDLVDEAHEFGMKVVPWTVNNTEDMEKLYRMGVDGMITDKPWVMRKFLEEKGEGLLPVGALDLPYHLEPEHINAEEAVISDGRDASY